MFVQESQKQPPEVFCKKGVFENFAKFTGKHMCWSLFLCRPLGHTRKVWSLNAWALGVWKLGHLDSGRLDSGCLSAWTLGLDLE